MTITLVFITLPTKVITNTVLKAIIIKTTENHYIK